MEPLGRAVSSFRAHARRNGCVSSFRCAGGDAGRSIVLALIQSCPGYPVGV